MRAKILIPFRDGNRLFKAGEVIATNKRGALFLFSAKYAEPADDEARQFCQQRGYAQGADSTPAGA
jgi:hypothetical protein